jgi:hypothetical protein
VATLFLCAPLGAQQALFRNAAIGYGGGFVSDMKTADVNNDGKPDIILLQSPPAACIITLLGNGDGTFKAPVSTPTGSTVGRSMTLGDLDGDGRIDLVMTADFTTLQTYHGNGDGSFTLVASQTTSIESSFSVILSDLNRDGKLDLIAYVSVDPQRAAVTSLATFRGNGDGTFGPMLLQPNLVTNAMTQTAVGDFNGDGLVDVIMEGTSFSGSSLATGNGAGGFNSPTPIAFVGGRATIAGDFNGDGKLDFIVLGDTQAVVHLGDGHGNFTVGAAYTVGGFDPTGVAVDLDGDGKLDFMSATSGLVTVLHGNGDGTFVAQSYVGGDGFFFDLLLVADFDGDHHLDVLTRTVSSLLLLHGNGDGTLVAYKNSLIGSNLWNPPFNTFPTGLAVADFNGDGRPDVVTANGGIIVLLQGGDGRFGSPIPLPASPDVLGVTSYATGDVNGDGKADIVVIGENSETVRTHTLSLWTYLGNGNGTFTLTPPSSAGNGPLLLADVNGDGKLDVLSSGQLHLGHGDGTFEPPSALAGSPAIVADFNGDGRPDFATGDFVLEGYTIFLNNGSGGFVAAGTRPEGSLALGVGDFNGDGKLDLVEQSNFGRIIVMRLGNGDGTFTDLPQISLPLRLQDLEGARVIPGDFDGDGKLDLAFGNAVLLGNGDGTFRALAACVPCESFQAATDVNGDGAIDLLGLNGSGAIDIFPIRTTAIGATPHSLMMTSSPSPLHAGEEVALTTTAVTSSSFLPSGSITIIADGGLVGFAEWNERTTLLNWVNGRAGAHEIVATFIGDDVFPPAAVSLTLSAVRDDSIPRLETFLEPSQQLQPTPLNATIFSQQFDVGTAAPTGTITIRDGVTVLFSGPYDQNQQPKLTYSFPTVGTHNLTLEYSGDANFTPGTATLTHVVTRDNLLFGISGTPSSPITVGQTLTLLTQVNAFVNPTGTITFLDNGVPVGSVPAVNTRIQSIAIQPTWGFHTYTARYSGNADFDPASTRSLDYTVNLGPFGTPIEVRATAVSATNVNVDWSPLTGVTTYDLFRRGPGGSLTVFSGFTVPHVNDTTVAPNTTYLYQVVAHNNAGATSAPGVRDWATTVPFTDDPLVPGGTTVKALHILELRTAINAMRAAAGLPAATWSSDPTHAFIRASDLTELRAALAAARAALGAPVAFTDPTLTPRATTIRGIHFQEIRDAVK